MDFLSGVASLLFMAVYSYEVILGKTNGKIALGNGFLVNFR